MIIEDRIRRAMKNQSIRGLSRLTSINHGQLSQFRAGKARLGLDRLSRLAATLGFHLTAVEIKQMSQNQFLDHRVAADEKQHRFNQFIQQGLTKAEAFARAEREVNAELNSQVQKTPQPAAKSSATTTATKTFASPFQTMWKQHVQIVQQSNPHLSRMDAVIEAQLQKPDLHKAMLNEVAEESTQSKSRESRYGRRN